MKRAAPGPARMRRALVRARFRPAGPDGPPVLTVRPGPGSGPAVAAAARALAEAGHGHLGGHLELRAYGPAPRPQDAADAARRAVRRALAA
ncbi:hypothetical protein [Streptomyces sp. NPDC059708]|uniref:hypothetical protein n=1 Tax=Streptomyces sp. NPDC059708 TaxID=3346916 RepID=UPI0036C15063